MHISFFYFCILFGQTQYYKLVNYSKLKINHAGSKIGLNYNSLPVF